MRPFQTTSVRDRTSEFLAIAEKLQAAPVKPEGVKHPIQQQSDFAKGASQIGLRIHQASVKLQKLAQLAKRTSTFDDPAEEIGQLTGIIKQDIQALNAALSDLQRLSAASREANKQSSDHSHTVVDNLRTRLKDTTQEFKEVLTLRSENLKANENRRQKFSATPNGMTTPLLSRQGSNGHAQNLFGDSQAASTSGQNRGATSSGSSMSSGGYQQQQLVDPTQDRYMNSRAEALRSVEGTIVELSSIFQQLAHMVQEQGDLALRIDENVGETVQNVQGAYEQLLKYLNNTSSNLWLGLKVFGILAIFVIIFLVFLA